MPSQLEFEGKDVDFAVQKASKKLNIPAERLKYSVISYGSTGIFGLVGAKKARIRVTVPEGLPENPKKVRVARAPQRNDIAPEPQQQAHSPQRLDLSSSTSLAAGSTSESEIRLKVPAEAPQIEAAPKLPEASQEATSGPVADKTGPLPDPAALQAGMDALQQIVDAITTGASIAIEKNPEHVLFNISAANSAVLIGKHGQTLDAMQYLVEKIVNRQNDDRVRVLVDIEGYLKNRTAHLQELAGQLAEKVKRTGKPASAGQMNANDRKIIHMALKDDTEIRTQSMGEGLYRKLMIFPKRHSQKKTST